MESTAATHSLRRTRNAFLWTSFFDTPFWVVFNMLSFILYKDLGATPFQVSILIALKPLSSLLAMYWGAHAREGRSRLVPNVLWGTFLRHLPFLFCPFVSNPWFYIGAFGLHMVLARGTKPAWMEILKLNIPEGKRERVFTLGTTINYVGDAILPFFLGWLLDGYVGAWRWVFPLTALFSMVPLLLQWRIPIDIAEPSKEKEKLSLQKSVVNPWMEMRALLGKRRDFFRFQMGFMLGGAGLMIMQPVLPLFFVDTLDLSYTQFAVAVTSCKGIGFAMMSPLWARIFNKANIFTFSSWVTAVAFLCPLLLLLAHLQPAWLYLSFLLYGAMQAGSSLSWNLSGPLFSSDSESSVGYTNINVVTVGLRGCIVPFIGSALAAAYGLESALFLGSFFCLLATGYMAFYGRTKAPIMAPPSPELPLS